MTPENLRIFRSYFRLPPQPGGMEEHIAQLTKFQRQQGIDVFSVYNVGESSAPEVRIFEGKDLNKVSSNAIREFLFYTAGFEKLRAPQDNRHNILHVHGDFVGFFAAKLWRHKLRIRTMAATLHSGLTRPPAFYRWSLKGYDVIAATGYAESRKLAGWLDREVLHMPSGVAGCFLESHRLVDSQTSPVDIIAVGNLFPVKRTALIVELAGALPHLSFAIYGDGPERTELEKMAQRKACGNLVFHGRQPREVIARAMQSARLFVNVSTLEGTPTSVLEAMACGLPVVLTPSNEYRWLISQGTNGYLTEGWDIAELKLTIERCLADESRRKEMGERNRVIGAQHGWGSRARFITERLLRSIAQRES